LILKVFVGAFTEMRVSNLATAALAAVALTAAATPSHAAIVNWTVTNGLFDDNGTLNGTFTVDTVAGDVTQWNLTTTAGSGSGSFTYSNVSGGSGNPGFPAFFELSFPFVSELDLTNVPLNGPGTVSHLTGGEFQFVPPYPFPLGGRSLVDGQAVGVVAGGVPEPATWMMMLTGFGLAGALLRARRRGAAVTA
jgi:hypothetical protein